MPKTTDERLKELEDERDVIHTMYQYSHALDYGLEDEFLDCFTETGVWRSIRKGLPGRFCEGREGLKGFFAQHTHAPALYHKHLMVEPRIVFSGDQASVESYFVRVDEHPEGSYLRAFGRYKDQLVRCSDERWRIADRFVEIEDFLQKEYPGNPSKT